MPIFLSGDGGTENGGRSRTGGGGAPRQTRPSLEKLQNGEGNSVQGLTELLASEGFSPVKTPPHVQDMVDRGLAGEHREDYETRENPIDSADSRGGGSRRNGGGGGRAGRARRGGCREQPQQQQPMEGSSSDDNTSVDSAQHQLDGVVSRNSSFASPSNSASSGRGGAGGGDRQHKTDNNGSGRGSTPGIPSVSARPAVPFGASALSKTLPNNGRGRPRGLRPRGSSSFGSSSSSRTPGSGLPSSRSASVGVGGKTPPKFRSESGFGAEQVLRTVAQEVAPGVALEDVVRAAVKIESVMRVLIARGYVRRKLVSEVTAFSLIMERGIEVIKHPFSGKAKPKNVTVNFVSRKGAMQLSWGGKGGVPLETIYGVTKGIKTDALKRVVGPERGENCFSLLTSDRTIDFEVDNPWLVLLVVRAMRLFLGAHYDTLPAPTFFSHLCVRPRGASRSASPKQTLVWTGDEKAPGKEMSSTPTERTSGDSDSDSAGTGTGSSGLGNGQSPWERIDEVRGGGDLGGEESYAGDTVEDLAFDTMTEAGSVFAPAPIYDAAANERSPSVSPPRAASDGGGRQEEAPDGKENIAYEGDIFGEHDGDEDGEHRRSPGGIMSLFGSGRRSGDDLGGTGTSGDEELVPAVPEAEPDEDQPLTASQVMATRGGPTKRLNLAKRLQGPRETALKGKRFNLMALPTDLGEKDRRERGMSADGEMLPKRNQGMSISIGTGYQLPEEQNRRESSASAHEPERMAVVDDLNDKLQSLRKLCVPQQRIGVYRPGKGPKTMAIKHMAFFQGAGGSVIGGMGSVADMWGDGVRRQYQTDMVRQKNESVEDIRKRDDVRTAMLVNRSGVHRVTRKAGAPEGR